MYFLKRISKILSVTVCLAILTLAASGCESIIDKRRLLSKDADHIPWNTPGSAEAMPLGSIPLGN